jgi:hypothetical protein
MKLNGTTIKTPQKFIVTSQPIEQTTRLASGKLVKDIIAVKKQFNLSYSDITGTDLATILSIIADGGFVTLEYQTESGAGTATVTTGEIPRELWSASGTKRYRDVEITLTEQ